MTRRIWPQWIPALLLAVLCLALIVLALRGPGDMEMAVKSAIPAITAQADATFQAQPASRPSYSPPPQSAYDVMVARNLFDVNRQPPPDNETPDDTQSVQSKDFALEGVLRTPARSVAILLDKRASRTVRVTRGDAYGGWTLESVADSHVILSRASENLRLDLPSLVKDDIAPALTANGVPQARPLTIQPRRGRTDGSPVRAQRRPLARQMVQPDS